MEFKKPINYLINVITNTLFFKSIFVREALDLDLAGKAEMSQSELIYWELDLDSDYEY